jgi:acyl-CoA thioesterase-1
LASQTPSRTSREALGALPLLLAALLLVLGAGCERRAPPAREGAPQAASQSLSWPAPTEENPAPVILMLGDSLTAGFGLPSELAYPALVQERLEARGYPHRVVNAGVSGDTSAGGLSRLDWLLRQRVDILLLALGANDGLRGQDPDAMRANLAAVIERAQARGIRVVLAGMQMPANYGLDYTRRFSGVYPELARRYDVLLIPFLLDGVAMNGNLNQADGIHPNAEGARVLADTVWKALEPLLER